MAFSAVKPIGRRELEECLEVWLGRHSEPAPDHPEEARPAHEEGNGAPGRMSPGGTLPGAYARPSMRIGERKPPAAMDRGEYGPMFVAGMPENHLDRT